MLAYQDIVRIDLSSLARHAREDEIVVLEGVDDIDNSVILDFEEEETHVLQTICQTHVTRESTPRECDRVPECSHHRIGRVLASSRDAEVFGLEWDSLSEILHNVIL